MNKKGTTYAQSFYKPDPKKAAAMNETVGINKIIGDLKTLGFKKKPHHQSCR